MKEVNGWQLSVESYGSDSTGWTFIGVAIGEGMELVSIPFTSKALAEAWCLKMAGAA